MFLKQNLSPNPEFTGSLNWLVTKLPGASCLCLSRAGSTSVPSFVIFHGLQWLFLIVNLATSKMNYNPEMEDPPMRDYFCFV